MSLRRRVDGLIRGADLILVPDGRGDVPGAALRDHVIELITREQPAAESEQGIDEVLPAAVRCARRRSAS